MDGFMIAIDQLQQALHQARPGTTFRIAIEVTVPDAQLEEAQPQTQPETPVHHILADGVGPLTRALAIKDVSNEALKESEWAERICTYRDFSARELEKACRVGAIASTRKSDGRDSGARLIEPAEMVRYLVLRDEVLAGEAPKPTWWTSVIASRLRRAS
jgi:hypothetical protein